jgi:hypothetical protein
VKNTVNIVPKAVPVTADAQIADILALAKQTASVRLVCFLFFLVSSLLFFFFFLRYTFTCRCNVVEFIFGVSCFENIVRTHF